MKNILYIGQYGDSTGLGASSRRYIEYLASNNKYNLAIRPIYVTSDTNNKNNYDEYENNSYKTYDTLIQHVFPEYIEYNSVFGKNIAITEIETRNIRHSGWIDKLNLMDEIWVASKFSADSLIDSGVNKPIRIIPEPYNIKKYTDTKDSFFKYTDKPFIFYTIGEYAEKKNIKTAILAYLLEFNQKDNVKFFIKTSHVRKKNEDLENLIKYDMSNIKNIIRKPPNDYPDIDVLCGNLSDNDLIRLHQSSDCYINCARADGFGANAVEAALCDSVVINTKNIGSSTYFNKTNALMLNSVEVPVLSSYSPLKNIFTIYEKWFEPSINDLRISMRQAYNLSLNQRTELSNNFNKNLFTYDFLEQLLT